MAATSTRDDDGAGRGTTERVLALLGLLQQRRVWTGPELAGRTGVTTRTVRRDVDRLRALGYPVHSSHGEGGGYQLGPGQSLPPLLLDDDEAIATAVSLLAGAGGSAAGAEDAALRTLTKLDRVLPARLRPEVRALASSVRAFDGGRTTPHTDVLMTLARACRDEFEVGFGYRSGAGEASDRRVEPYRLVTSGQRWYLFAFDRDRDDWRTFRLDRMTDVTVRTWRFRPRTAPDAAAFVQDAVANRVYPQQARFLVRAPAAVVRAQIPAGAAVVLPLDADPDPDGGGGADADGGGGADADGGGGGGADAADDGGGGPERCEVRAGAHDLDLVLLHVTLLGHPFEVLDPPHLRRRCADLSRRLSAAAGDDDGGSAGRASDRGGSAAGGGDDGSVGADTSPDPSPSAGPGQPAQ